MSVASRVGRENEWREVGELSKKERMRVKMGTRCEQGYEDEKERSSNTSQSLMIFM